MIEIGQLNNGIRVVCDYMKDVETTSIKILVNTGSRNENIKNNGISHFIEHMAFKGTKNRNAKQIAYDFENIGASFNAYTSVETTAYYSKQLKEYTEKALEILIDMIDNSIFDNEELEKERGVILQELAMTNDTPDDIIYDYYKETAFNNQPYGRSILGPAENIKNFQKNDFLDYINTNYTADNIVLSVAGKITLDEIINFGNKYFKERNNKNNFIPEKAKYTAGCFKKEKDLEQVQCIIGFEGLSYNDENKYKISVMNHILGSGMSSRLFQEVRENKGLCYTVYSFNSFGRDVGSFEIYTGIEPENTNKAIDAIIDELKKATETITRDELERSKIKLKSSILMGLENTSSRASSNGADILKYGKVIDEQDIIEDINSTTIEEVQDILKNIICSTPSIALYGKVGDSYDYDLIKSKIKL